MRVGGMDGRIEVRSFDVNLEIGSERAPRNLRRADALSAFGREVGRPMSFRARVGAVGSPIGGRRWAQGGHA